MILSDIPNIKAWKPFSLRCIQCRRTASASNLYCVSATFIDLLSMPCGRDDIHQTEWPFKMACRSRNRKHKFDKKRKVAQLQISSLKNSDQILFFDFSAKLPSRFPAGMSALHPLSCLVLFFFASSFSSCESLSCDVQIFQGEMIFAILRRFFLLDKFKRILTKTICTTTPPSNQADFYPKGFVRKRRAVFIKKYTHRHNVALSRAQLVSIPTQYLYLFFDIVCKKNTGRSPSLTSFQNSQG